MMVVMMSLIDFMLTRIYVATIFPMKMREQLLLSLVMDLRSVLTVEILFCIFVVVDWNVSANFILFMHAFTMFYSSHMVKKAGMIIFKHSIMLKKIFVLLKSLSTATMLIICTSGLILSLLCFGVEDYCRSTLLMPGLLLSKACSII